MTRFLAAMLFLMACGAFYSAACLSDGLLDVVLYVVCGLFLLVYALCLIAATARPMHRGGMEMD